jgi:serine O-acetyltransferase
VLASAVPSENEVAPSAVRFPMHIRIRAVDMGQSKPQASRGHQRPQERLVVMMRQRPTRWLAYKTLRLLGVEIPPTVKVGDGLQLAHGAVGLVIHEATEIGNNVKIFQGVTLGFADEFLSTEQRPLLLGRVIIEDNVIIGAGAKVLFKVGQTLTVGNGAIIGANAVVLSSVPPGETWVGVPARPLRSRPQARTANPDRRLGTIQGASRPKGRPSGLVPRP